MKKDDIIYEKFGRNPGFKVPDGYFESFFDEMPSKLPPYKAIETPQSLSMWERLKPYVYFAAMFGGIWLMMNLFNHVSQSSRLNLDNPPESVAIAMASVDPIEFGYADESMSDFELMDEVAASYDNISDFVQDFGYSLKPEFRDMKIPDKL